MTYTVKGPWGYNTTFCISAQVLEDGQNLVNGGKEHGDECMVRRVNTNKATKSPKHGSCFGEGRLYHPQSKE